MSPWAPGAPALHTVQTTQSLPALQAHCNSAAHLQETGPNSSPVSKGFKRSCIKPPDSSLQAEWKTRETTNISCQAVKAMYRVNILAAVS